MGINDSPLYLYLIAGGLALLIGLIITVGVFAVQRNSSKTAYDEQLADLIATEAEEAGNTKVTMARRWNHYWSERFKAMGWAKYNDKESSAGRDIIVVGIIIAIAVSVFLKNALAGPPVAALIIYVIGALMKSKANKEADVLNAQLPGFLFALKANIQANETPERAVLKVVDNMPEPLHSDLIIVKNRILANSSFRDALEELAHKTSSKDLQFLCACMIQATGTGANLENQITVIQKVLEARRKVSDELAKAVRSAMPAIWIASVVIPGAFIFSLMADTNAANFWFKDPLSWAALAGVVFFYGLGVWLSKKLVDNIRNL